MIYVGFLVLKRNRTDSLLFHFTFFSRSVTEHMFELKYFVARNGSPGLEPKRKIQLVLRCQAKYPTSIITRLIPLHFGKVINFPSILLLLLFSQLSCLLS